MGRLEVSRTMLLPEGSEVKELSVARMVAGSAVGALVGCGIRGPVLEVTVKTLGFSLMGQIMGEGGD